MSGTLFNFTPNQDGPGFIHTADHHNIPFGDIANILNGGLGTVNFQPNSLDASVLADEVDPTIHTADTSHPFIISGLTIGTSGSLSSTIASGVAYVNGQKLSPSSYPKTFTASKDTYVYLKDDGTYSFSEVANNSTSPAAVTNTDGSNALLVAIVVTSGSAVTYVNQGAIDATTPAVSSVPLQISDALGNLIHPVSSNPTLIGYRQHSSNRTPVSNNYDYPELVVAVNITGGQRIKITAQVAFGLTGASGTSSGYVYIRESGSNIGRGVGYLHEVATENEVQPFAEIFLTPSVGTHTYSVRVANADAENLSISSGSYAAYIAVERVG